MLHRIVLHAPPRPEEINCLFILEKGALLCTPWLILNSRSSCLSLYGATAASEGHCGGLGSNFVKVLPQPRQSHRGSLPAEASFRSVVWSRGPVPAFPCFYLSTLCGRYLLVCSFSGLDVFNDGIFIFLAQDVAQI